MGPNLRTATGVGAITIALLAMAGCAGRKAIPDVLDSQGGRAVDADVGQWSCVPIDGPGAGDLVFAGTGWSSENGRMTSTHVSRPESPLLPGRSSPAGALDDAVAAAAESALELLEQRGVGFNEGRRKVMVMEAVRATSRGDAIAFPRMSVTSSAVEECVPDNAAVPDTCWRAVVRVEYPIGHLRGDANNVRWERTRAANEARVLKDSAAKHLADGRWLAGLLEAARAADVVFGTGLPVSAFEATPGDSAGSPPPADPVTVELIGILDDVRRMARDSSPLNAHPISGMVVLEAGAAAAAEVEFELTYRLSDLNGDGGTEVHAAGVPVVFSLPGASAILYGDAVTDYSGMARCRVAAVNGPPGEYELGVRLDTEAVRSALLWFSDPSAMAWQPLATAPVHVVRGTHATPVCFELDSDGSSDATQVVAGFTRRMERDGFRVDDCGPGVAVVITGEVSVSSYETGDGWGARALLRASAFDQRTALRLGDATITTDESVAEETAGASDGDARRSAEVLALKEAGRLLAVYFEGRILSSGS